MNREIVRDRFLTGTGACIPGVRITMLSVPELGTLSDDPLTALEQQHQHGLAIQKSMTESIEFEQLPQGSAVTSGCILQSELFGERVRVIRYSPAAMAAAVMPL
jgi:hypothetical protein